jgi:predicted phage-related endonuclease
MFHGRNLEKYIADLYPYWGGDTESLLENYLHGNKVARVQVVSATVLNPKYPFLFANIDRKITKHRERKGKGVLEIKTISSYHADMWAAGIPPSYLIQLQQYMIVMGFEYGEIAMLTDGRVFSSLEFDAHPSLQDKILTAAEDFYNRVQQGKEYMATIKNDMELHQALSSIEPEVESTLAYEDYMSEKHKRRAVENTIEGDDKLEELAGGYVVAQSSFKEAEKKKLAITNEIKQIMEGRSASVVDFGDKGTITWRKQMKVSYKPEGKDAAIEL